MTSPTPWLEDARALQARTVAFRRDIHQHPELGLDLPRTTAAVRAALQGLDVDIVQGTSNSGLIVTLKGDPKGATILLRGDMDALPMDEHTDVPFRSQVPGAMHACGHDAHTAMLVSAVHLMHAHRDRLAGTVKFMFQPGEEGDFGARHMIEDGLLDLAPVPQAAFAIHISPNIPAGVIASKPGAFMAAPDQIAIRIKGQGGHASTPHLARDPIPVAAEMVMALQALVARRIDAFDPVVLTIAKIEAGTTHNVIPESAHMLGTLRTFSERSRAKAHEGIRRIVTKVAEAHEMEGQVEITAGYPVTVNNAAFVERVKGVATALLGEKGYRDMPSPVMGAEDWSYVLQRLPGAMVFLGVAPPEVKPAHAHSCHSNRMVMDEDAMAHGVALHAAIAEEYLASAR
ncbi:MAG: amidohydrolase [Phenylobacterium sp.]|uniref:M20 metallopeptidase family protein n=1 Tax=Phenylobacterium sp. TaxID=1871053 RepID=UPI001B4DDF8F|nr:M20 family metallopeptidase [Phenylobacterium sp.]MBP7815760.1 amidohydrolase [Phenylobacterium sp.]MBP9231569.1 amidohydrolase [Phenylobacterium sp.]MBP9756051.1 amidohydrolase [Phenylobacterium sp.]